MYNADMAISQLEYLEQALQNNSLAHAYLFIGPKDSGGWELLEAFLPRLLSASDINHPDVRLVKAEGNDITISQIRELRAWLSLSAISGTKKIAVIDGAEKMNIEAQNGFLKVLEEPSPATYIFLLAGHARQLLPTIFSRVVPIYFNCSAQETSNLELLTPFLAVTNASERLQLWMKSGPAKDEVRLWLEKAVTELRQLLLQTPSLKLTKTIRALLEALSGTSGQNWNLIAENVIMNL